MARFGRDHAAKTLVVAGVRFMGETAKILSPGKRVLMPDLEATCSLDLGCPPDDFAMFCDAHPDRQVVVYANTSAAVKARADWMVTSSCALAIVQHLKEQGQKILWAPDRHLGRYIQQQAKNGKGSWKDACAAKLYCTEAAVRVGMDAVQVLGGYGYMREYPVEKMMRDAKITQIYEGTNQIQREVIATHLIKESASQD